MDERDDWHDRAFYANLERELDAAGVPGGRTVTVPAAALEKAREALDEAARATTPLCAFDHGPPCDCTGGRLRAALAALSAKEEHDGE